MQSGFPVKYYAGRHTSLSRLLVHGKPVTLMFAKITTL